MVYRAYIKVLIILISFGMVGVASASTITVTDKLGKKVSVNVPVKRAVVVISYELIPALNLWSQVSGVSRWAEDNCGLYRAIVMENSKLKRPTVGAGSDINVEAVLKLNPDVVITWTYNPETIRFLEEKGITVIGIYPDSLAELYKDMRMHGRLFGKEKRVEEVIREMEKIFKLISEKVSKIPYQKRKKVIHLGGAPTRVSAAVGVTNDIIKIAGGVNPAGTIMQRNIDVSIEKIVEWNPDVIFIWGSAGYDESWLYSNSQWRFIKAVQTKQVYKLPKWSTWSPRLAPIALYMAMKIYPEAFRDINFEKVADDFYKKVFGISYYKVRQYEGF
ncbi:ABC transporter substrate-binding protein [Thermodesulfovibrio yellowstonii]|uniref:ABC transporter substrate-binding protein n=1 Tax=Thermodesulfovibrio yellowstonii TaxID=28262 RepID=A0A9W6GE61_9BACT|nr:ABC transporter substrate-binding protein [Thermodesulfovibrio islandicus]GLI53633.1 ABC transporter substrate-binding protein [Thermodesulfovibrio islandicus]